MMSLGEKVKASFLKLKVNFQSLPVASKKWLGIGMTLALVLALPLFVWGVTTQRFDVRKRAATGEPTPPGQNLFTDVDVNSWSWKYIQQITSLGLMPPRTPTTFEPAGYVTRAEMAEFLCLTYRYLKGGDIEVLNATTPTPFTDIVSLPHAFQDYIATIYNLKITAGTSATTFSPNDLVNRAQMVTFLMNLYRALKGNYPPEVEVPFIDINDPDLGWSVKYIKMAYGVKITAGTSATNFSPRDNVTREQMAAFISNTIRAVRQASPTPLPSSSPVPSKEPSPIPTQVPTPVPTSKPTPSPFLQVVYPNGNEQLVVGVNYPILWKSSKTFSSIDLQYVTKNGFYNSIAKSVPDTGMFVWQVNTLFPTEKEYKIYIYGYSHGSYMTANDTSDNYFFVVSSPAPFATPTATPVPQLTTKPWPTSVPVPTPTPGPRCRFFFLGVCWLRF